MIQSLINIESELNCARLSSIKLYDQDKNLIETRLNEVTEPLHDGAPILLVDLLRHGKYATEYQADILDPITGKNQVINGQVRQVSSQSASVAAVKQEFKWIQDGVQTAKDHLADQGHSKILSKEQHR